MQHGLLGHNGIRRVGPVALGICLSALASCVSAPSRVGYGRDGFTAARLSSGHYRLTFAGKANVSLDEVKGELLRHTAQLTLAAGYSHFVIYTNSADAEISKSAAATFWNELQTVKRTEDTSNLRKGEGWPTDSNIRYTATSDIVMLKDEAATRNPDALSAKVILDENAQ